MFNIGVIIAQQIARQVATQAVQQITRQLIQQMVQQLVQQLVQQMVQQLVQQIGQQMGMSQGVIDQAKNSIMEQIGGNTGSQQSVGEAVNDISQQLGFSPQEQGELQRTVEDFINKMVRDGVKDAMETANDEGGKKKSKGKGASGDFFQALAEILGKQLNGAFNDLKKQADSLNWKDPKAATDFQAQQQKFGYFMQSITTALKTIGEALATAARKQ